LLYLFNDLLGLEDGVGVGHKLLSLDGLLQLIQLASLLPIQAFLFPRLNTTGIRKLESNDAISFEESTIT
jgi:hypothetical protein